MQPERPIHKESLTKIHAQFCKEAQLRQRAFRLRFSGLRSAFNGRYLHPSFGLFRVSPSFLALDQCHGAHGNRQQSAQIQTCSSKSFFSRLRLQTRLQDRAQKGSRRSEKMEGGPTNTEQLKWVAQLYPILEAVFGVAFSQNK